MPGEQQFQNALQTLEKLEAALPESPSDYHPKRFHDLEKYSTLLQDDMTAFIAAVTGKSVALEKTGQELHGMAEQLATNAAKWSKTMDDIEKMVDPGAMASFRQAVTAMPAHFKDVGTKNDVVLKAKRRRFKW